MNARQHEEPPKINLELVVYKIDEVAKAVDVIQKRIENGFVERVEFELRTGRLEKLVYGMVGVILLAVVGALISLVIKK